MASNSPQFADVFVEVASDLLQNSGGLFNFLRRNLFVSGQAQQGDDFMDQSRDLLQRHLQLIQLSEQTLIRRGYTKSVYSVCVAQSNSDVLLNRARDAKETLDEFDGSKVQKYLQARKYKRRAKKTFKFVKVNLYCSKPELIALPLTQLIRYRKRLTELGMTTSWVGLRRLNLDLVVNMEMTRTYLVASGITALGEKREKRCGTISPAQNQHCWGQTSSAPGWSTNPRR
jgi:hypothetical protein